MGTKNRSGKRPLLYLASQSRRRRQILSGSKVSFKVVTSAYREKKLPGLSARMLVERHARAKVEHARIPRHARWVLGADTVVAIGRRILGKPDSRRQAASYLKALQGRTHDVYTGLALLDRQSGRWYRRVVKTRVTMRPLERREILEYFRAVNPFDKAGAYAIQAGPKIILAIKGSYTNVVGLPVEVIEKWRRIMGRG